MSSYWASRLFGRSTDYLSTARDYMATLCSEPVNRQMTQVDAIASGIIAEEIGTKADMVDDYHPNTPSSSVADEKDLAERNDDLDKFDSEHTTTDSQHPCLNESYASVALKNVTLNDKLRSLAAVGSSSESTESLKHVTFYDRNERIRTNPYVNSTKVVVINESDMSSDESGSPKHVQSYEHTGTRPKSANRSISYNSSNSARSMVLDHSMGGRSPMSSVSRTHDFSNKMYDYPILIVSPHGTIAVYLRENCIVEMTINKMIRVECQGKFSAATNPFGNINCILHPDGRILQHDTRVQCLFGKNKVASFGPQGVSFNMKPLPMAYIVSSKIFKGTTPVPANCIRLPPMDYDFTTTVFYTQSITGPETVPQCQEIVRLAKYKFREDGSITVLINGVFIRQDRFGNILVNSRPRTIRFSPQKNTISVRTHFVDMAVQEDEKAFVKRGVKRVHVSKSGMVVSDGNCITSMDHFGRIVSST